VHCIDRIKAAAAVLLAVVSLAACSVRPLPPDTPPPGPVVSPPAGPGPAPGVAGVPPAAPMAPPRNWDEYKLRAAQRITQANPSETFSGALPESLASIPVLQVQLNADGSIRSIDVLRTPRFHPHTLQLATQAIRRAAPFGPVGHLPRPWQFSETFLYNDDFKFQLRTLAETP
jgi:hypothetical protein